MKKKRSIGVVLIVFLVFVSAGITAGRVSAQERGGFKFEISYPEKVHPEAITGRVYAIISRSSNREPRFQTGFTGVPIWGKNIVALKADEAAVIDEKVFSYPLESIKNIPPGEYFVQGFINIYTEFKRSDSHTLWLHNDQWEGQKWNRSPGNLYSNVRKVTIDPAKTKTIRLNCNNVIPPVRIPEDTKWVKRIKFKSEILTRFWGQPIYLGATVLLPKGYDEHPQVYYPVNYIQGHFSLRAPHGFQEPQSGRGSNAFSRYWTSESCPRLIAVTFQHPCPYYDDSYAVNSPNCGPYGDAIMQELISRIEKEFRIIRKPYARILSGGSTGGWESLALQVFHPDFFGGTFTGFPDPIDFRRFQLQNIYEDENMFYTVYEWLKVDIPETRSTDGDVSFMMKDRCHYEQVIGDRLRSGEQWAIWQAVFTPLDERDGYPREAWDWYTGEIDHEVTEQWKKYDLCYIMRNNWKELGPKLVGKIHLYTGDMDNAYLNLAVVLTEQFLESTKEPYYAGSVTYGDRQPHGWMPRREELIRLIAEQVTKNAPPGEDTSLWKYKK